MAKLNYMSIASLDGYIEDASGKFDWAKPDEEVHTFVNDLERSVGTYLYGRRMYEVMKVWQSAEGPDFEAEHIQDFARIWQEAEKVVYSTTLEAPATPRTRIEPRFDPDAVRELKASADRDLAIGGPELAAHAFRSELIDECHLFVAPIAVGGGKPCFPGDLRVELELLEERRFRNGTLFLRYGTAGREA